MCLVILNCISLNISVFLCLCLPDWRINVLIIVTNYFNITPKMNQKRNREIEQLLGRIMQSFPFLYYVGRCHLL